MVHALMVNVAANMVGVELALITVVAHLTVYLGIYPYSPLVAVEMWAMASVLMMENAAANMAGVELALSIVGRSKEGSDGVF